MNKALRFFEKAAFFFLIAAFVGLFLSRAILSFATILMIASLVLKLILDSKSRKIDLKSWVLIVLLIWLSLSFFYTDQSNKSAFFSELGFKLSFVGLYVFTQLFEFNKKQIHIASLTLGYSAMIVAIGTFVNYAANYAEINELISQSKPIPIITGYFHISFSFMLAASVCVLSYLSYFSKRQFKSVAYAIPIAVNFLLMHVVVARTGLVAMYGGVFTFIFFYFAIEKKKWIQSIATLLMLLIFGIAAITFVKPLNNRYKNTLTDLNVYLNGENANWWSGAMRLHSIENAWYIFKENPILGVGMADLSDEVDAMFEKRGTLLLPENRINPHNQFVNLLVVGGLPSFLLIIVFFALSIWHSIKYKNWLLLSFVIMAFIGFNLESFLERQFGSCFFGLWFGLLSSANFSRK